MVDVRQEASDVDLYFRRGDYMEFPIRVPDPDVEGEYLDLSEYTFFAQVRLTADSDTGGPDDDGVLAELLVEAFDNGAADRGILVTIDDDQSKVIAAAIGKKSGVWDCQFSFTVPPAKPRTWFAGEVWITKDVARAEAL